METINDRISYLVDIKTDGVVLKFAELLNVTDQNIRNIIKGRKTKPGYDMIISIIQSFDDISPDWLLLGKGGIYRSGYEPQRVTPEFLLNRLEELAIENKALKDEVARLKAEKKGYGISVAAEPSSKLNKKK